MERAYRTLEGEGIICGKITTKTDFCNYQSTLMILNRCRNELALVLLQLLVCFHGYRLWTLTALHVTQSHICSKNNDIKRLVMNRPFQVVCHYPMEWDFRISHWLPRNTLFQWWRGFVISEHLRREKSCFQEKFPIYIKMPKHASLWVRVSGTNLLNPYVHVSKRKYVNTIKRNPNK